MGVFGQSPRISTWYKQNISYGVCDNHMTGYLMALVYKNYRYLCSAYIIILRPIRRLAIILIRYVSVYVFPRDVFSVLLLLFVSTLQWHHNGCDSVSNHQPYGYLLNCLFRRRSKKTSKLHVTGLCMGNSPVTGEFPTQMASNAENASIWWRDHEDLVVYK